ncbi:PTS galactitol transporter subunit IIB [Lactobacillus sp. ESL0680]|uniref:PTS galactitol transporter subunit IIB n=1 Tax=Lactobacillus sp. ESL0680 TaxID=2983210 RepID=UPI0023F77665|nr:PTS galactitol transporter subunit IIB [Lactobacillus sp. ESL0680]WEV38922.1 PTS galactitol transporter subunit IIB [Lactobacillus sp. ESL0680]
MKTILVCCGTGVATSPQVANKINDFLADQGLDQIAEATPEPVAEAKGSVENDANVIIYVGIAPADGELQEALDQNNVVGMVGLPWLTGMGQDEANQKVADIVKQAK